MSLDNLAIARVLAEIGDLLEIKGENPFKIRAYRNASETIAHTAERIADLLGRGAARDCRHRQGPQRQDRRARRHRRHRLPPGAPAGVSADHPRPAAPAGRRAEDRRDALPRARDRHARRPRARGARGAPARPQGHGREEGSLHPEGPRRAGALDRPAPDGRSARDGGRSPRRAPRARARGRHLAGRQPAPRLRDLRRPRHPRRRRAARR